MTRIFLYSVFMFFFVCCVLFGEGVKILEFVNTDDDDFRAMCEFNVTDIEDQQKWVQQFVKTARRFDLMSEVLLNEYMCTDTCPCLSYNNNTNVGNPEFTYNMLREVELNRYRRSNMDENWAKRNNLIKLKWTSNQGFGFKSFQKCYQYYADR